MTVTFISTYSLYLLGWVFFLSPFFGLSSPLFTGPVSQAIDEGWFIPLVCCFDDVAALQDVQESNIVPRPLLYL